MRLHSLTSHPLLGHLPLVLLLLSCCSTSVLSQTFLFDVVTDSLPWSPRNNPNALLSTHGANELYFCGGANGRTANDVWSSADNGTTWTLLSGQSSDYSAPGAAANASFPPSAYGSLAYDAPSRLSFHYGGYLFDNDGVATASGDTWYSTDGSNWAQAVYATGAPAPVTRDIPGTIVTTSNSEREGSFLLVGGAVSSSLADSTQVWKSSAVSGKPDVREWTLMGSMLGQGNTSIYSFYAPVLLDQGRLDGRDILYLLGGPDISQGGFNDAVWASSDEGATWVQLTNSSFGARAFAAATVTDTGILFVAGGFSTDSSTSSAFGDLWASFDGGYTWSLCTNTLTPRQSPVLAFNPFHSTLAYGMGFGSSSGGGPLVLNDLYYAGVSDPAAVADDCGTTIPSAGVGLTQWPASVSGSSSTGGASGSSSGSSAPTAAASSSSAAASSTAGPPSSATSILASTSILVPSGAYQSSSSAQPPTSAPFVYRSSTSSPSSSSSSSSSTSDNGGGGGGGGSSDSSSSNSGLLTTFTVIFAALTVACAVLAYTQYRLRVYGTVCCEWCAGVTCGQLCGETMGWGTKAWQRRSNLSDADLLRQVATDRYD